MHVVANRYPLKNFAYSPTLGNISKNTIRHIMQHLYITKELALQCTSLAAENMIDFL